jgi:hypothetical protein
LTKGSYGRMNLNIAQGARVNINNGIGSLTPGTYHIITMLDQGTVLNEPNIAALNIDVAGTGFATGDVPGGYDYQFLNVIGSSGPYVDDIIGIDLVVTASAVPEPASIGVLGIGTGLMLLRKRRR